jgi:hypothetical protein
MTPSPETKTMTEKLMPCPLCHGNNLSHGTVHAGITFGTAGCRDCDLKITSASEAESITAWNTRHPAPAADEVEAEVLDLLFQIDNLDPAEIAKSPSFVKETVRESIAAMQAKSAEPAREEVSGEGFLCFRYKNYRGEVSERTVRPIRVYHGATEWHPAPQWLLEAFDMEKDAVRAFAMADIQAAPEEPAIGDDVDRVAQAMYQGKRWEDASEFTKQMYREDARRAIAAMNPKPAEVAKVVATFTEDGLGVSIKPAEWECMCGVKNPDGNAVCGFCDCERCFGDKGLRPVAGKAVEVTPEQSEALHRAMIASMDEVIPPAADVAGSATPTNPERLVEAMRLFADLTEVQKKAIAGAVFIGGEWVLTTKYEDHPEVAEDLSEAIADCVSGILTPLGAMIRAAITAAPLKEGEGE